MIFQIDAPQVVEYAVEMGYGVIYLILTIFVVKKYRSSGQKLALYFSIAFLCLAISGLYGGFAGLTGSLIGGKILEIYEGLSVLSLVFFLLGLMRLK